MEGAVVPLPEPKSSETLQAVDDAKVRAEPFEAFELDLAVLWQDVRL